MMSAKQIQENHAFLVFMPLARDVQGNGCFAFVCLN
jgi:hypothetical protein